MCSCFNDFPGIISRVYDHLRPGGYAEFLDFAFEIVGVDDAAEALYQASSLARFIRCCIAGGATRGKDFQSGRRLKGWMAAAGLRGVAERQFLVPLSAWPLDPADRVLGSWSSLDWVKFLGGSTKLLEAAGVPLEEIPGFLERVRSDILDRNMRVYWISEFSLSLLKKEMGWGWRMVRGITTDGTLVYNVYGQKPGPVVPAVQATRPSA